VDGGLVEADEMELGLAASLEEAEAASFAASSSQRSSQPSVTTESRRKTTLLAVRLRDNRDAGACSGGWALSAGTCAVEARSSRGSSNAGAFFPSIGSSFRVFEARGRRECLCRSQPQPLPAGSRNDGVEAERCM